MDLGGEVAPSGHPPARQPPGWSLDAARGPAPPHCAIFRQHLPLPCLVSMCGLRVCSSSQSLGPFRLGPALCWASLTPACPGWCPGSAFWSESLTSAPPGHPRARGLGDGPVSAPVCRARTGCSGVSPVLPAGVGNVLFLPPMYAFSFCLRWTGWGLGNGVWSQCSQCRTQGGKPETASSSVVRSPPFPQEPPACREDPGFAWLSWPAGPLGLRH